MGSWGDTLAAHLRVTVFKQLASHARYRTTVTQNREGCRDGACRCVVAGQENVASHSQRGVYLCGAMFHHSLALERRTSKERLERRLSKESQSALLEANLTAKDASPALHLESSPVSTIPNLPSENDLQSLASAKSASIHGRSTPSESSRRRQKHTTFADQKQQQLEHMCAAASPRRGLAPAPHLALAVRPSPASRPR